MAHGVEQAWALPVETAILGAHLTAYIAMRETIETLRLCNRFGRGDAGITTLPIELVAHIELHLLEDKRGAERETWEGHQRCNQEQCEEYNHLDDDSIHDMYHRMQTFEILEYTAEDRLCIARDCHRQDSTLDKDHFKEDFDGHCDLCEALGPTEPHSPEHIAAQRTTIKDHLKGPNGRVSMMDVRDFSDQDYDLCLDSYFIWRDCTRRLGGTLSTILRADFGLDIRVVHGPWTDGLDRSVWDLQDRPTSAYLHLPTASGRGYLTAPSAEHLARFTRAVQLLGLEVTPGADEMDGFGEMPAQVEMRDVDCTIASTQPRIVTFAKYVADKTSSVFIAWELDYQKYPDRCEDEMDEPSWRWAVVKD